MYHSLCTKEVVYNLLALHQLGAKIQPFNSLTSGCIRINSINFETIQCILTMPNCKPSFILPFIQNREPWTQLYIKIQQFQSGILNIGPRWSKNSCSQNSKFVSLWELKPIIAHQFAEHHADSIASNQIRIQLLHDLNFQAIRKLHVRWHPSDLLNKHFR